MNPKYLIIGVALSTLLISSLGIGYVKFVSKEQYDAEFAYLASGFA